MNVKILLSAATLAVAAGNAFAAKPARTAAASPTLAVQAAPSVGEQLDYPYFVDTGRSSVSRADVRAMAVAANAGHPLAGEAGADVAVFDPAEVGGAAPSMLTRAQVHAEVLAARAAGTLPEPGDDVHYPDTARSTTTGRFDAAAHPVLATVGNWFKHLHGGASSVASS